MDSRKHETHEPHLHSSGFQEPPISCHVCGKGIMCHSYVHMHRACHRSQGMVMTPFMRPFLLADWLTSISTPTTSSSCLDRGDPINGIYHLLPTGAYTLGLGYPRYHLLCGEVASFVSETCGFFQRGKRAGTGLQAIPRKLEGPLEGGCCSLPENF